MCIWISILLTPHEWPLMQNSFCKEHIFLNSNLEDTGNWKCQVTSIVTLVHCCRKRGTFFSFSSKLVWCYSDVPVATVFGVDIKLDENVSDDHKIPNINLPYVSHMGKLFLRKKCFSLSKKPYLLYSLRFLSNISPWSSHWSAHSPCSGSWYRNESVDPCYQVS